MPLPSPEVEGCVAGRFSSYLRHLETTRRPGQSLPVVAVQGSLKDPAEFEENVPRR